VVSRVSSFRDYTQTGRDDKDPVSPAPGYDLGISRHDGDTRLSGGLRGADHASFHEVDGATLFQDQGPGNFPGTGPCHCQIIHRTADGQVAEISAGKDRGIHNKAVGRQCRSSTRNRGENRCIGQGLQMGVLKMVQKEIPDQALHGPSAGSVG